jgi:hypothetical protein
MKDLITAAVEPIVDEVIKLEKRIETIQLTPGHQGERGEDGKDGASPDPEVIAKVLADHHADVLRGVPGVDGKDGADGKNGTDGKDGASVTSEGVAYILKADSEFQYLLKGDAGKDGDNGADGKDGSAGINGADGASPPVDDVAKALFASHADALRGFPGKDGKDGAGIDAATYKSGQIYREGSVVIAHIGQHFWAKADTYGQPGDDPAWERIGSWGMRHRGAFDKDVTYVDGDIYVKDFGSFVVINGDAVLLAGRGAKGERGAVGPEGAEGKRGVDGASIIGAETEGFKVVLVQQNSDGEVDHLEMDFEPAFKASIAAIKAELTAEFLAIVSDLSNTRSKQ